MNETGACDAMVWSAGIHLIDMRPGLQEQIPKAGKPMPLVSVIIPTHNRAGHVGRAISSALAQTVDDIEIIVVDDCSCDATATVVRSMAGRNMPNIVYLRNEKNLGGSASRNVGIGAARSRYLAFLDDDDEWLPTKLEKQLAVFGENPALGLVYTGYFFINEQTQSVYATIRPRKIRNVLAELLKKNCVGTTSTAMVTSKCLKEVGGFDQSLRGCQDWDLWIRIAKKYAMECIQEPLVKFYDHDNRISRDNALKIEAKMMLYDKHKDDIGVSRIAKSCHFAKIGQMLCHDGRIRDGKVYLAQAIRLFPFDLTYYKYFACSLFGTSVYSRVLGMKRSILGTLKM